MCLPSSASTSTRLSVSHGFPGNSSRPALPASALPVPALIAAAGDKASEHFLEFFAATIRNKNTRAAYVQAAAQFCSWCEQYGLQLSTIRPLHVSAYIESKPLTAPSIKQHLVALRDLFNWLVIKEVVPDNPALFVKGPKFSRKIGVTPIMEGSQVRLLLDSIPVVRKAKIPAKHGGGHKEVGDLKGLRDRAVIAVMAYTFGRVSAVAGAETRRLPAGRKARPHAPARKRRQGTSGVAAP
jgi:integrase/recombinase XerD